MTLTRRLVRASISLGFALAFGLVAGIPGEGTFGLGVALAVDDVIVVTAKRDREQALAIYRECREGVSNLAQLMGCNSLLEAVQRAEKELRMAEDQLEAARKSAEALREACRVANDNAVEAGAIIGALGALICPTTSATRVACGAAVGAAAATYALVDDDD